MKFGVFSDFACPFCYIGFTIAHKLVEENPQIQIYWYPYELDSEVPEGGKSLEDSIPKEQIEMSYRRIERLGSEYGLVYNNKVNKFNTGLLHRAALYAQEVGRFYPFAAEAFKAIFTDGRNVALKEVINDIGLKAGLNIQEMMTVVEVGGFEDAMQEAKELAEAYGIESVPTFVREDGKRILLLKDYEKFKRDLME
jgi:predicted DsbA family dithiol-disulfide isomerase